MEKECRSGTEMTVLRRYFVTLLVLWTALVAAFLAWSLLRLKHDNEKMARIQARHSVEKDLVYRRWVASRGGVYVPLSDQTPPNPYLAHIEERDITTPSGRDLTLVNPAYMTRQVYELGLEEYGIRGHITSLNPLRPANAADEWETKALQAFERGVPEVLSIETLENQDYLRFMRPMTVEPACLSCHAEQGYRIGDLRGGISVSVPMAPIRAIAKGQASALAVGHLVLWLLGVAGISLGGQRLRQGIQGRTHAEEQIESLAKFPSENPNPVLRVAKSGILLYANDASGSLLAEWHCQINQIVPERWRQIVAKVFASGSAQSIEMEHAGRTFAFVTVPVFDAGYVNLYGRDISARKQAETALQEAHSQLELRVQDRTAELAKANEQLKKVIQELEQNKTTLQKKEKSLTEAQRIAHFGNWDWSIVSNELAWTDETYHIFGLQPREFGATNEAFLESVHPDDRASVKQAVNESLTDPNKHYSLEHRVVRPDGSQRIVHEQGEVTFNEHGQAVQMIGIVHDITERRNTEKETHRLREEYVHIARVAAMGELTASLAHELKQPLAAIRSNAQAAQRFLAWGKPNLNEFREILADIVKDNRRADDIIRKLRTLMQKGDLQITELNINDVIREIAPITNSYQAMRHISLEFELDEGVLPVAGDRVQLQQVLLNLVLNASEALMNEDIDFRKVVVRTTQREPQYVTVAVEDSGTGIEEQLLEHLFTPFYTTKREGLGMGLAISRSIIEMLNGKLWAENNPDQGATFYFTLPIAKGNSV
ncbi:MAG: DUF3365 domain-containing protein [Phycisphaeraceae bacterium]|nr:DUF3365 domain-containing protein [Phycisphaeraceae bacterium]